MILNLTFQKRLMVSSTTAEKFNGLIDIKDDIEPYYGSAPPSFVDLLFKFGKEFKILSSE